MIWTALSAVASGALWFVVRRRADARIAAEGHQQFGGPAVDMLLPAAALILSATTVVLFVLSFTRP